MKMRLVRDWLGCLDQHIGRTPGRKFLLLPDNCYAHRKRKQLPELQNIRVEYLLSNMTSKMPALDAGIIASVKKKYLRWLLFRMFERMESGRKSMFNVYILAAMRCVAEVWSACPKHVIKNCFVYYFKQRGKTETGDDV